MATSTIARASDGLWLPGSRSVADPIPLGEQADGTPVGLSWWTKSFGLRHPRIGGATGSGKTNTLNVLTCGLAACRDTVIWVIEVAKAGRGSAAWLPCIDWLATTRSEAVSMLRAGVNIIDSRARDLARQSARGKGPDKVTPSPTSPALIIIIDEGSALFASGSGNQATMALAAEATELARTIAQTGREMLVGLVFTTQRPTTASAGDDGDLLAQLHPNLCLRMNRRADIGFVLQGVDLDTVDTTLFNVPGLLYVQEGPDVQPMPVRSYALYQPNIVYQLASWYATARPSLEPVAIRAAGEPYAARPADPFALPAPAGGRAKRRQGGTRGSSTIEREETPKAHVEPARQPTRAATSDRTDAVEEARATVASADRLPEVPKVPMAELGSSDVAVLSPADATIGEAVEAILESQPAAGGLTLTEITNRLGETRGSTNRGSVLRAIRGLVDDGTVVRTGTRNRYRYTIESHPESDAA